MTKRELIEPKPGDKRYVRRDEKGHFTDEQDDGREVAYPGSSQTRKARSAAWTGRPRRSEDDLRLMRLVLQRRAGEISVAAKPSSERIDESPVAVFHERSSGIRENARRTAIALEIFRQEIESGLKHARAVGASHSEHQVEGNQSVTGERDLQLERARATLECCARLRSRVETNLVTVRRLPTNPRVERPWNGGKTTTRLTTCGS